MVYKQNRTWNDQGIGKDADAIGVERFSQKSNFWKKEGDSAVEQWISLFDVPIPLIRGILNPTIQISL